MATKMKGGTQTPTERPVSSGGKVKPMIVSKRKAGSKR